MENPRFRNYFPTYLCGVLVFDSVSRLRLLLLRRLLRNITHIFVTHLCQPPSLTHTQLCHKPSFTHIFVTHLCQPPSLTHNFVTSFTHIFVTHHLSDTTLSHTIFHRQLCHFHTHHLCVAGVTSTFVSRGRRGTWRHPPSFCVAGVALRALDWLWWRAWTGLVAGDAAALCVAGVVLGDIHLRYTPFLIHNMSHALFHTQLSHTHHLSHTTLSHTPSFFVTQHLSYTTLSYTIFFLVDPPSHPLSFLHSPSPPAFVDQYWKKLTCGVIRSPNFLLNMRLLDFIGDVTAGDA